MSRIALVTGAAQGIGAGIAQRLLEEKFAGVVLLDRNGEALAKRQETLAKLGPVATVTGDLSDVGLPARAVGEALSRFGRLDVLVNAAGNTERGGIDDTTPAFFERVFNINVRAPLFLMQEALKPMRKAGFGTIVNISSMLALGGPPDLSTYSASKAALNTLTKAVANTVKRDGVRVFAINLGWAHTEGEDRVQMGHYGKGADWSKEIGTRMPSGRMIEPADVAGVVAFLVSAPARMMNGTIIDYEQVPFGTFDAHPALGPG
ncbi:MAG: SDR family oxidoreductase [Alphaproteobacteria bacterium]|nr:SDR family oxidoreductase [Alphaproteobacteria bacterium]